MIRDIVHFLKSEKKYTAIFLALVLTYAASQWYASHQPVPPESPIAKQALQDLEQAEKRMNAKVQEAGSLESFLRDKPELAGLFTFLVFFVSGVFSLGVVIILAAFFNPTWRQSWAVDPWFEDRTNWNPGMLFKVVVLFLSASYGLSVVLGLIGRYLLPEVPLNFWLLFQTTAADLLCIYFIIYIVKQYGGTWQDIGLRIPPRGVRSEVVMGTVGYMGVFPIFCGILLFLVFIAQLFSYEPPPHPIVNVLLEEEKRSPFLIIYSVALATFVAPILEEVFFRGFCYPVFRKRWGKGAAMVISSVFFAIIHHNTFAFWPIFVLGMALSYLYEKRRSLIAPVVLHLIHNTVFILYFFLAKQALINF